MRPASPHRCPHLVVLASAGLAIVTAALVLPAETVSEAPPSPAVAPAATSTLQETIARTGGVPGSRRLERRAGEPYLVRRGGASPAPRGRSGRRRTLAFFAQLTDPQIEDEASPGRVEFLDPGPLAANAWRPQEALGLQTFDQIVRSVNRNRTSRVRQGTGGRARLQFAVTTGDLVDSPQLNTVRSYIGVLEGRRVDPFSGKPIGPGNPCPGATPEQRAQLDAAVAGRRYTGVQDYDDYPGLPARRYAGFWDPDASAPAGAYARFPRYPGLMERAQRPFVAEGLQLPWYTARGNHDALVQGVTPETRRLRAIATGCRKLFPTSTFEPATFRGRGAVVGELLRRQQEAQVVPPDPDRRAVSQIEFKQLHGAADRGHGYGLVGRVQHRQSRGAASYYAWTPRATRGRVRFVSLDTVAEGGGSTGNIDHPQYRWLARELDLSSSFAVAPNGRIRRDRDRDRLIVIYGHHTLGSLLNTRPDESAGRCAPGAEPGCDRDPRSSRPVHRGYHGSQNVRDLLLAYPNVVAYVGGHVHRNEVYPLFRRDRRGGFWQIHTASHIDYPQQSRLIELMDNRDGTLSIFGTTLNHAAPIAAPRPGADARSLSESQLGSISRLVAANDPELRVAPKTATTGQRPDRNVELVLKNPLRLAR